MNYLVCIDDTDMPGTKGTGWLAEELCGQIKKKWKVNTSSVSRHQLFVHEDIPYTSHNSAMCFKLSIKQGNIKDIISFMADFLETRSEPGSDPGLCVADLSKDLDQKKLIKFGKNAKQKVSSKEAAYNMAKATGIHLSEHGGTGQGVVGAVAGVGLRLSGDDGRYRGWYHLGMPGEIVNVEQLCKYSFIDEVITKKGVQLKMNTNLYIGSEKTKIVRVGGKQVIVTVKNENYKSSGIELRTITKEEAKQY